MSTPSTCTVRSVQSAPRGPRWIAGALCAALVGIVTMLTSLPASAATSTISAGSAAPPVATTPATVMKLTGDDQTVVPGATFPDPLAVRVTDSAGNPVAGVPVTFTVTSGSATLSTAGPEPTSARGAAAAILTAGNTPGPVAVDVSVPGTAGATFRVTVAVTAPQPRADLVVSVTGPRTARARSTVRYTVSVHNRGPSDAHDVAVVFAATGIRVNGTVRPIRVGRTTLSGACWTAAVIPAGGRVRHTFTGKVVARPGRMLLVAVGAVARSTSDPAPRNNVTITYLRVR